MNKAANVRITNELKNPSMPGMHYRLVCMTGPDKGKVYYLSGKRIIIGRGEKADIQIIDSKTSREHAELSYSDNSYTITDLGAHNSIIVNNDVVKQKKLVDGEKIVIGQTVFKYNAIEVLKSELVLVEDGEEKALAKDLKPKEVKKNIKLSGLEEEKDISKKRTSGDNKKKPNMLVFGIVIAIVLYFLMGDDDPVKVSKKGKANNMKDDFSMPKVISKKISLDDIESKRKLETYIHSGRREFSEGNYFRAMEDFRLALLLKPDDRHASFYLEKARQRLDEDIQKNFLKGKQDHEAKKLQAAVVSYCGVVQLIQRHPDDQRYKDALTLISAIESEMGLEKGEIKCFEEKSANSKN
jgi:pSer/pThr/pTyr-binding forkhead associated (FHA) protein